MIDLDKYHFQDVTVTPFYSPANFFAPVSCIGGVSIPQNYFAHGRFGQIASRSIHTSSCSQVISRPCVFGGFWLSIYGHFLIETLQRLYFIAKLPPEVDIVFPYVMGDVHCWQQEILALLGVRNNIVFLQVPTLFRDIYVPPPGASLGWHLIGEQIAALGKVEAKARRGEKLFISRAGISERGCVNEAEIEILLKKRGWEVMRPERLTVGEQLSRLARAETVFAVSGSALHSVLLLREAPQRFIVVPRIHNETYNIVAHAKCSDYHLLNIPLHFITKSTYSNTSLFSIDTRQLVCILEASADFRRLGPIQPLLMQPKSPPLNYDQIPEAFLTRRQPSTPADNMTWQILAYLRRGVDFTRTLRKARWLMASGHMEAYMKPVCHKFVMERWPREEKLFAQFFNCSTADPSYETLRELVLKVVDGECKKEN